MQTYPIAVEGFSPETDEQTLFNHFKSCGSITKGVTISYLNSSRRVGYIQFIQHDGQLKALEMNGTLIGTHTISVRACK